MWPSSWQSDFFLVHRRVPIRKTEWTINQFIIQLNVEIQAVFKSVEDCVLKIYL